MNPYAVIFVLLLIIGMVLVYRWYIRDKKEIISEWDAGRKSTDGSAIKIIPSDKVKLSTSQKFTFSVWVYLKEWDVQPKTKIVFQRVNKDRSSPQEVDESKPELDGDVYFSLDLGKRKNEARCLVQLTGDKKTGVCTIPNIPVQRWVHLLMSVESSIIDMYMDGKLYKHCQFDSPVHKPPEDTKIILLGGSPFQGRLSKLEYIRKFITPQHAWDIYVDGPRDSSLVGSWLNRYMLRIQWLKDGNVDREYKI
jgi:hypothetical protein